MEVPWVYKQDNEDRYWLIVGGRRIAFLRAETIAALRSGVVELVPIRPPEQEQAKRA